MLIIGCGNRQRGDDAAGILVAEQLRSLGIEAEICSGESSDLIELLRGVDDVIVIDSVLTGGELGAVHLWDAQYSLPLRKISGSTHGFGVAEAIELSRALDALPHKPRIYGIEGKNFEIGSAMSPEVEDGVHEVVRRIVAELKP